MCVMLFSVSRIQQYGICGCFCGCFFFKQKTAYELRISDWSSDVCSSDLGARRGSRRAGAGRRASSADGRRRDAAAPQRRDRKSVEEGKSVSVRVDLGGRSIIKIKT